MCSLKGAALAGLTALVAATTACSQSSSAGSRDIAVTAAPVPARYAAGLPTTAAALESWARQENESVAPVSHVVDSVLTGSSTWLARLEAAANAVAAADRERWVRVWSSLFEFEVALPLFCSQTRAAMAGVPSVFRDVISHPFARACVEEADVALVLRADTPSRAVLGYFSGWNGLFGGPAARFDPRLVEAAGDIIINGDEFEARMTAFTLIGTRDARADAALLEIHSRIADPARADQVALAFLRTNDDEGTARAKAACKRIPNDTMCTSELRDPLEGLDVAEEPELVPVAAIAERIAELRDLGFTKVGAVDAADVASDATEEILLAARHAYWFDVETGFYPNQHDSLLRHLAALVSPDLDDVIFEEIPPELDDESGPYELHAYSDGKLLRTQAENLGDWYDLDAVLTLVNAVMSQRQHAARFTVLASGDQTAIVVAAPPAAIAGAAAAGLLELGDVGDPERVGKEFEERLIESLRD